MFSSWQRRPRRPQTLRLRRGVRIGPREDGLAVISPRGTVLHLDHIAALMLRTLLDGHGVTATAARLAEQFHVPQQTVHTDVLGVIAELTRRKVVYWR